MEGILKAAFLKMPRWILALALIVAGFWLLYLALFNWWVAGGPPGPRPEFHRKWGNIFFFTSIVSFSLSPVRLWVTRQKRPT